MTVFLTHQAGSTQSIGNHENVPVPHLRYLTYSFNNYNTIISNSPSSIRSVFCCWIDVGKKSCNQIESRLHLDCMLLSYQLVMLLLHYIFFIKFVGISFSKLYNPKFYLTIQFLIFSSNVILSLIWPCRYSRRTIYTIDKN